MWVAAPGADERCSHFLRRMHSVGHLTDPLFVGLYRTDSLLTLVHTQRWRCGNSNTTASTHNRHPPSHPSLTRCRHRGSLDASARRKRPRPSSHRTSPARVGSHEPRCPSSRPPSRHTPAQCFPYAPSASSLPRAAWECGDFIIIELVIVHISPSRASSSSPSSISSSSSSSRDALSFLARSRHSSFSVGSSSFRPNQL